MEHTLTVLECSKRISLERNQKPIKVKTINWLVSCHQYRCVVAVLKVLRDFQNSWISSGNYSPFKSCSVFSLSTSSQLRIESMIAPALQPDAMVCHSSSRALLIIEGDNMIMPRAVLMHFRHNHPDHRPHISKSNIPRFIYEFPIELLLNVYPHVLVRVWEKIDTKIRTEIMASIDINSWHYFTRTQMFHSHPLLILSLNVSWLSIFPFTAWNHSKSVEVKPSQTNTEE